MPVIICLDNCDRTKLSSIVVGGHTTRDTDLLLTVNLYESYLKSAINSRSDTASNLCR